VSRAVDESLYPCFVHIRELVRRNAGDGCEEGFALFFVAFPEGGGFFLELIRK